MLNIVISEASDGVVELLLLQPSLVVLLIRDRLFVCYVHILSELDEALLANSHHRLGPVLEGAWLHSHLEVTHDVENKGRLGERYMRHACINHHTPNVVFSEQLIRISVIQVEEG